jgi:hypothetical protein
VGLVGFDDAPTHLRESVYNKLLSLVYWVKPHKRSSFPWSQENWKFKASLKTPPCQGLVNLGCRIIYDSTI